MYSSKATFHSHSCYLFPFPRKLKWTQYDIPKKYLQHIFHCVIKHKEYKKRHQECGNELHHSSYLPRFSYSHVSLTLLRHEYNGLQTNFVRKIDMLPTTPRLNSI